MISVDGAGLIAQVIPVFVLILVFEGRALADVHLDDTRTSRVLAIAGSAWALLSLFVSFVSEAWSISAVIQDEPIRNPTSVVGTVAALWMMGTTAYFVAFYLLAERVGLVAWIRKRHQASQAQRGQ